MSFRDRIQAIKNSSSYRKDYERYVKKREQDGEADLKMGPPWDARNLRSKAGKRLCKKWGLLYPIAPDAPLVPFMPEKMKSEDLEPWMVEAAVYPVSFPTEDDLKDATTMTEIQGQKVITHLSGKLCLLIDTDYPPSMLMHALQEFVEHFSEQTKERSGKPMEDPWKIYSLHQQGMNLLQITHMLHGVSRQPAYDNESDYHYRRVSRAYSKALRMIEFVEKASRKHSKHSKP